ncbi:hypothetical protein [Stutzerimonas azotifigens]|uniref:hypothetical protein n=1 Tax=Stutzerimonas azotifigens TaxID=291995 RepID=UPI0004833EBC|nr:hypothetical protein [Stutzerimonas azotifigens]
MKAIHSRWPVIVRVLAAILGGYAFTYATTATLARLLPFARYDAAAVATLLSFVVYLVFVLWAFSARTLGQVLAGVALSVPLAAIAFWPQLLGGMR